MDSLSGTVASYFTVFGKSLVSVKSEAMVFISVVICLFFFFVQVQSMREKGQLCSYLYLVFLLTVSSSWVSAGSCF